MRQLLVLVVAWLPLATLAGPEPWTTVQSAGGMTLGPPFHSPEGWLLVVRAKLSSLKAPAQNPNGGDSHWACKKTLAVVEGRNIYLTIVSAATTHKIGVVCPAARVGELESGSYKVLYRGPGEKPVFLQDVSFGTR